MRVTIAVPGVRRSRALLAAIAALAGVAPGTAAAASPPLYTATELPPLSGYDNAWARAISNQGHDLNDRLVEPLGFVLEYAADINDRGDIVGWGREGPFEEYRAFLLEPVPPVSAPADAKSAAPAASGASPNPFGPGLAPATRLSFHLGRAEHVTVDVVDVAGRRCRLLHEGELAPGSHTVEWNGRDASGRWLPAGAYWLRVRGRDGSSASMVVLRR
jgi:hypothetical protein